MKTTKQLANEMADQVFQIRDAYMEKKKRMIKRIISAGSGVCVAAAALLCFGLYNNTEKYITPVDDMVTPESEAIESTSASSATKGKETAVSATKTTSVTTTVSAESTKTANASQEQSAEMISDDEVSYSEAVQAEERAEDTKTTSAVTASKPTKTTTAAQTKPPVRTTPTVTEETELPTDVTEIKGHKVFARFCDIVDSMDNDNYTSKLTEMYKDLYEILDGDYMSDEGRTDALTRLHNKEYDMDCLFPRVTDIINGNCSPDAERMTLDLANDMIENTDSFNQIYWGFMSYEPDVIEDFGLSGKREYWLDNYGAEKILFYPSSGNVVYDSYGDETKIYPKR